MEEILALRAKMMQVQQAKPKKMLSERNTMEILEYIKKTKEIKIISTIDGKEFLTLDYLDKLIYETCLLQKKARILELEGILNISSDWIESRIDFICKKYGLLYLNNQFLTKEYIAFILQDISNSLKTTQICLLSDFAIKHDISISYLKSFLSNDEYIKLIDVDFNFDERTNLVISQKFYDFLESKIRGILNGSTQPISIKEISKIMDIEKVIVEGFFQKSNYCIENEIIYSKKFIKSRKDKIIEIFKKNGIIEFNYIQKHFYISKPKSFLIDNLEKNSFIILSTSIISKIKYENILVSLEQSLKNPGYVCLENLSIINLNENDQEKLINLLINDLKNKNIQVENKNGNFVLKNVLNKFVNYVKKELMKKLPTGKVLEIEKIKEILLFNKKIEFGTDDNLMEFIFEFIRNIISLRKLHQLAEKQKLRKSSFKNTDKVDLNSFEISDLMKRVEYICNYFLLLDKNLKNISKKFSEEDKLLIDDYLQKCKIIVLENITFLILRKFQIQISLEDQNDFSNFLDFESNFEKIFKSKESFLGYFFKIPKDIKKIFIDKIVEREVSDQLQIFSKENIKMPIEYFYITNGYLNLKDLLNTKGTDLTIGLFNINKQKKQEKSFLKDLEVKCKKVLTTFECENEPERAMVYITHLKFIENNSIIIFDKDIDYLKEFVFLIRKYKFNNFSDFIQEYSNAFEKFDEYLEEDLKESLEVFFNDLQEDGEVTDEETEEESDEESDLE